MLIIVQWTIQIYTYFMLNLRYLAVIRKENLEITLKIPNTEIESEMIEH